MTTEQGTRSGWFRRNWKWLVPVLAAFCVGWILFFMHLLKSSEIYELALTRARSNKTLIKYIGKPIDPGFFIAGKIGGAGPNGSGYISFPISGPKGSGTISGTAEKASGKWKYLMLDVMLEDGSRIDLMSTSKQ